MSKLSTKEFDALTERLLFLKSRAKTLQAIVDDYQFHLNSVNSEYESILRQLKYLRHPETKEKPEYTGHPLLSPYWRD